MTDNNWTILAGSWAYRLENYVPVDEAAELPNYYPAPEELAIRKELFENLSAEAKQVVHLILNAPQETLEALGSPITGRINTVSIGWYLRKKIAWPLPRIRKVVKELTIYANNL